ncbi:MAG: hypothetical protein KDB61_04880, partial [Planctomycetes bacterium]|nr:hypothetical protein [Planctomycetota bacterium]
MGQAATPLGKPSPSKQGRSVLLCELRQLVRDRRALFATIVLPMLLYPWLLYGQNKINDISQHQMAERTLEVSVDLSALPEDQATPIRTALDGIEGIVWSTFNGKPLIAL